MAFDGSVGAPVLFELAGTHGPSGISGDTGNPKDRAELMTSWQKGPLTLSPSLMFVGHFNVTDPSAGVPSCAQGVTAVAKFLAYTPELASFCNVNYFLETNVYGSYQVSAPWVAVSANAPSAANAISFAVVVQLITTAARRIPK